MQQYFIQQEKQLQTNGTGNAIATRFLQRRDDDFDIVKSFLAVSMIIAHGFQIFYIPIYNKHLTYYVLVGFVFLSGLTVAGVYQQKFVTQPIFYARVLLSRGLKLLGVFLLSNVVAILLLAERLWQVRKLQLADVLVSALLRDGRAHFSFDVLVSIGLTFVCSIALLCWRRLSLDLLFLGLGISALWVIETTGNFDYYVTKMTIVGLIGVLSGKSLNSVNWEETKRALSKWYLAIWAGYVVYQAALLAFDKQWHLAIRHYIVVSVLLLLAVYLTSYRIGLINYRAVVLLNKSLAKYLLFAYLFHLFFLRTLAIFIGRGNLSFTLGVSLFSLAATIAGALLLEALTSKYTIPNRLYSLVFK